MKEGVGTGLISVSPSFNEEGLSHADAYYLNTEGFVSKQGDLLSAKLGSEFEGMNVLTAGDKVSNMLESKKCLLAKYEFIHECLEHSVTGERVIMTHIESWFFKVTETLKMKCLRELSFTKFRPSLNLKTQEEVDEQAQKLA